MGAASLTTRRGSTNGQKVTSCNNNNSIGKPPVTCRHNNNHSNLGHKEPAMLHQQMSHLNLAQTS